MPVTNRSSSAEKIALFRALFRGRQEVWPLRFESAKTGRPGYSPVCGNEWVRGLLQSHGYLVARFLAEDLGKDLEGVLDAVLRLVATRERAAAGAVVHPP